MVLVKILKNKENNSSCRVLFVFLTLRSPKSEDLTIQPGHCSDC